MRQEVREAFEHVLEQHAEVFRLLEEHDHGVIG